jgi:ABC-2 type transport system ATP-binding protein
MHNKPIIQVRHLKKRYKGSSVEALTGIDLEIGSGEFFGLLGPNAAGKSTLISVLCGIISPSSGQVEIFGEQMNYHAVGLKRRIGLVPQEIALYPTLTVLENILYFGRLHGIPGMQLKEKANRYIRLFNLEEHRNKAISKCSGGMKRRVNLIAGVIHDPELILLDEPTLGVDPQLRSLIFETLVSLNKAGATLIYTTHYMEEAESLCKRVSIIDHGAILKEGSPEELIASVPGCKDLGQLFLSLTGRNLRD